ncbi:hypothetical protein BGZ70_007086 [Mortierella alpina]|uniref:F-box domain-containing protein n=1 Tax=Mortierella alpina TaxID=64518 RepID=A0A9P6J718_MORAP|nr:hypothetical protein BGZ70_007086 [Mortierella alpina]
MSPRRQVKSTDTTLEPNTRAHSRPHPTTAVFLHGLPNEIIFCVMDSLLPRDVVMLSQVSTRIRPLAIAYLASEWDIIIIDPPKEAIAETSRGDPTQHESHGYNCMAGFELFARMLLAEMCTGEKACPAWTDGKEVAQVAMDCCKRILRRLYVLDPINENWTDDSMSTSGTDYDTRMTSDCATVASEPRPTALNPYITSPWNLHVIARVMVDLVCRGHCLPETAVLILQLLTSLLDQDQFQYLLNAPDRNLTLQMPRIEDRVSVGQLCFQYLVPNIMALLKPPVPTACVQTAVPAEIRYTGLDSANTDDNLMHRRGAAPRMRPRVLPCRLSAHIPSAATDPPKNLTSNVLPSQQMIASMEKATAAGAMEKALSLPELLTCIGRYLDDESTIVACLCVCKQWKLQFEPLLWRHFHVASTDDYDTVQPSTELMERNAPFIRSLTVHEIVPESHATFYANCTQLEDLKIILDPVYADFPVRWTFMANVIRKLPRLQKISVDNPGCEPAHDFFKAIADCPNIIVLETQGYSFKPEDMEVYLRASATHMKRLSSTQEYFDEISKLPDGLIFQEMRYLDIREASGLSFDVQLDWIRRCPNLVSLRWEAMLNLSASQFCQIIPTACPQLTSLHLWTDISDGEIASILEALPRVEKLNMSRTEFGDKSMAALRRHFPWLKDLNLQYCYKFTSEYIHEALRSCPKLQSISGDILDYGDIALSPGPWICNGLQMFDVGLTLANPNREDKMKGVFGGAGTQEAWRASDRRATSVRLFRRLGQLTELQYLSIGVPDDDEVEDDDLPILDAELAQDFLAGLRHIKYFSCKGLFDRRHHRLVEEAVQWMVAHWPQLETIEARILLDVEDEYDGPGRNSAIQLLRKHGIQVDEYKGDADYELDHDEEYYGDDLDDEYYGDDFDDDGYDYEEDEDELEDLAMYLHQHTLD